MARYLIAVWIRRKQIRFRVAGCLCMFCFARSLFTRLPLVAVGGLDAENVENGGLDM